MAVFITNNVWLLSIQIAAVLILPATRIQMSSGLLEPLRERLYAYWKWRFEDISVLYSSGATALQGLGRQSGRRLSAKLVPIFADRGVSRGQRNGSPRPLICLPNLDRYLFYSSSSSIDLTRLSAPRSRPTATQKIW